MAASQIFGIERLVWRALESSEPGPLSSNASSKLAWMAAFDEVGRGCLAGPVVAGCSIWAMGKPTQAEKSLYERIDDSKKLSEKTRTVLASETLKLGISSFALSDSFAMESASIWLKSSEKARKLESLLISKNQKNPKASTLSDRAAQQNPFRCFALGLGQASAQEIDQLNIWGATQRAMWRAFFQARAHANSCSPMLLEPLPRYLLIDGSLGLLVPTWRGACAVESNLQLASVPQVTATAGDSRCVSIGLASIVAKVARDALICELAQAHPQFGWEKNKGYGTKIHLEALAASQPTPFHRMSFLKS
jgi:ribonuclease HII